MSKRPSAIIPIRINQYGFPTINIREAINEMNANANTKMEMTAGHKEIVTLDSNLFNSDNMINAYIVTAELIHNDDTEHRSTYFAVVPMLQPNYTCHCTIIQLGTEIQHFDLK